MKNIFSKVLISFIVITIVVIGLKFSNNLLVDASTSNTADRCGVNNGIVWNGTTCVRVCDIFHPWDPSAMKCSTTGSVNYYNNGGYGNNCALAYGSNFYFNGQNCVERNPKPNANYYGNPYNSGYGTQQPVYGNINYQNLANASYNNSYYVNNNSNWYPNTNNNVIYTNPNYNNCLCSNSYSDNTGSSIKQTNTTTYIITTTISQPKGIPIYLGNVNTSYGYNYDNYYGNYDYLNYFNNYNNNYYTDYSNGYYTNDNSYYGNYNYDNTNYPYINPMTGEGSYFNYGPTGYYDQYGVYHY